MYAVTGASGQLGRLVIDALLTSVPANRIVAAVRDPAKVNDLAAKGVVVREADYDRPETLPLALDGVSRVLLISSSALGGRARQHQAVIDAARTAGVELFAYTSMLHADATPAKMAAEHKATEDAIAASGLPAVLLRNGWYIENHLMGLNHALEHGAMVGAAGGGRFSAAARADYAAAAAAVLTAPDQAGIIYELAGDQGYTLAEFAAEVSRQADRPVAYRDLPKDGYKGVLLRVGLPEPLAEALADEDHHARSDSLFDDGQSISRLIGRPTTSMQDVIARALQTPE